VRLISWNLAGWVTKARAQLAAVAARAPDLVALQEIRSRAEPMLRAELDRLCLSHMLTSWRLGSSQQLSKGPRQYGLLVASRWPLKALSSTSDALPWPERLLSVAVSMPTGIIELHTTGIPPGCTNGWTKIETFEGIYARLASAAAHPRILCGDFNSPQCERTTGEVVTWGQYLAKDGTAALWGRWKDRAGRSDTGERWDRAERQILTGLSAYDLTDVFRQLYGYERTEASWYWGSGTRRVGRRFDHVFASRSLRAYRCMYLHDLREQENLSDHSAIEVDFSP
jgi:exonuclease III